MPRPNQFKRPDPHDTPRLVALEATVGSDVYNTRVATSDLDWKHYMFPALDDLYANHQPSYERLGAEDHVYRDVRLLAHQLKKTNLNTLELLYSPRLSFHPSLEALVNLRDDLARVDLGRFYESALGTFRQHRDDFRRSRGDVNRPATVKYGYDPKRYAHLHRLTYLLETYAERDFKTLRPSLCLADGDPFRDDLLALRNGLHVRTEAEQTADALEARVLALKPVYHAVVPGDAERATTEQVDAVVKAAFRNHLRNDL